MAILAKVAVGSATLGIFDDFRALLNQNAGKSTRCAPGEAFHITQRGADRQRVFFKDADRSAYLRLKAHNLADAGVRVLAWRLMGNHIHIVEVAEHNHSLSVLLRWVHAPVCADQVRSVAC